MRDSREEGLDEREILQECVKKSKNTLVYRRFGGNRPIALINTSDERVHHELLPLSRDHPIVIGRVR